MISKTIGFRGLAYFQTHPCYSSLPQGIEVKGAFRVGKPNTITQEILCISQVKFGVNRRTLAILGIYPGFILALPSGKLTQLWNITMFNGKIHYKWSFSIAMLNYQRVYGFGH